MAVMVPREKWIDERLDDLGKKVDDGFAEVKAEMHAGFARVDGDIKGLQRDMNDRFDKFDARFEKVDARFDKIADRMLAAAIAIVAATIGGAAAIFAALIAG